MLPLQVVQIGNNGVLMVYYEDGGGTYLTGNMKLHCCVLYIINMQIVECKATVINFKIGYNLQGYFTSDEQCGVMYGEL